MTGRSKKEVPSAGQRSHHQADHGPYQELKDERDLGKEIGKKLLERRNKSLLGQEFYQAGSRYGQEIQVSPGKKYQEPLQEKQSHHPCGQSHSRPKGIACQKRIEKIQMKGSQKRREH
ncbi:hypothetical protein HKBW3S03_01493 [Candidatus Hakubella thermalkaliphila]|uniref:Uncharacterized protein n=1 Tax=Candidatus Hakubella thermalkaliphila TaxID=2754717 RepID=A0A6V8NI62_9ACTN|nr:hypothetical protein HKBW3S03_01493 [Candidatus Hakubella thermalkaliphila]